jgi:hypothetical protein
MRFREASFNWQQAANLLLAFVAILSLGLLSPRVEGGESAIPELNWVAGSDWLNVQAHGAVGDGLADDTAALQSIFSNLEAGDVIYFPPGVYRITDELVIGKALDTTDRESRLLGNAFYGHGASTVLRYDGAPGKSLIRIGGMLHYRMIGLTLDGAGLAARGVFYKNGARFQTHLFHQYILLRDFTEHGLYFGPLGDDPGGASAETVFKQMVFDHCGTGIAFLNFNDYNFTFEGCTFRENSRMAIECKNGNFYVRNCRFENNALDMYANPEHSTSIRRSVSVGSGSFLKYANGVSPVTVENCLVVDWQDANAITSSGAPITLFDNRFESSQKKTAVVSAHSQQQVLSANNTFTGAQQLFAVDSPNVVRAELPKPSKLQLSRDTVFIPDSVNLPEKMFDVKVDFGAQGDGVADDTEAIQAAIDAAAAYEGYAIAYMPKGTYRTTRTLQVKGSDYAFGGSGLYSVLEFDGAPDDDAIRVEADGILVLDAFSVDRKNLDLHKTYKEGRFKDQEVLVSGFTGKGADIRQVSTGKTSFVHYHTVYVAGKYKEIPFILGLKLDGLGHRDLVNLESIEGNVHVLDSGDATILHTSGYEGTVWVNGQNGKGFLGIMTRLATHAEHALYIEDSHSLVASDFYIEQAPPESTLFMGQAEDVPGRLTLGFVKTDKNILVDGYQGSVNLFATQFYGAKNERGIEVLCGEPDLAMFGSFLYLKGFYVSPETQVINSLGNSAQSEFNQADFELNEVKDLSALYPVVLDLRRLGKVDWAFNYLFVLAP